MSIFPKKNKQPIIIPLQYEDGTTEELYIAKDHAVIYNGTLRQFDVVYLDKFGTKYTEHYKLLPTNISARERAKIIENMIKASGIVVSFSLRRYVPWVMRMPISQMIKYILDDIVVQHSAYYNLRTDQIFLYKPYHLDETKYT